MDPPSRSEPGPRVAASARFELVVEHEVPGGRMTGWRAVVSRLRGGVVPELTGVRIFCVQDRQTGATVFRHIEDYDDDPAHLYDRVAADLASLGVDEFAQRWVGE